MAINYQNGKIPNADLLMVIFNNSHFDKPNCEITKEKLIHTVQEEYCEKYKFTATYIDVRAVIDELVKESIFFEKKYGKGMILIPSEKFYLIKDGKFSPQNNAEIKPSIPPNPVEILIKNSSVFDKLSPASNSPPLCDVGEMTIKDILYSKINSLNYDDEYISKYLPLFFDLTSRMLISKYTDWHTKVLLSSALGYFIVEDDCIPDTDENGFIDDLFILSYVLREIKKHVSPSLILENWHYEDNILMIIEEVFSYSYDMIGDIACEILALVGLDKIKKLEKKKDSDFFMQISQLKEENFALKKKIESVKELFI